MFRTVIRLVAAMTLPLALVVWLRPEPAVEAQAGQGLRGYRQFVSGGIRTFDGDRRFVRSCLARQRVLGGGCRTGNSTVHLVSSYPTTDESTGHAAWACEWNGSVQNVEMRTFVICADR